MREGKDQLLDQMAYLADELEAQLAILQVIPAVIWDARPPTDPRSLQDMYADMLARECSEHRTLFGLGPTVARDTNEPAALITALAQARRANVQELGGLDLTEAQLRACYEITQRDADALREVGLRLHETSMGSPRVKQL